jgi:hypothetical protein
LNTSTADVSIATTTDGIEFGSVDEDDEEEVEDDEDDEEIVQHTQREAENIAQRERDRAAGVPCLYPECTYRRSRIPLSPSNPSNCSISWY